MTREQFMFHVEATQNAVRRFLLALCCGNSALADDIAQESYMKAYLASSSLTDNQKFKPWIYRIAYNTFLNHKRLSRPTDSVDKADCLTTTDSADKAFRYQDLYMALDAIAPKERTAILLFYLEGYSIKEISDVTEATEEAVRQQLSRGRKHLRQIMTSQK